VLHIQTTVFGYNRDVGAIASSDKVRPFPREPIKRLITIKGRTITPRVRFANRATSTLGVEAMSRNR
jgi:hypothetical protein